MHIHSHAVISQPIVFVAHAHDDWPLFRLWFAVATVTASIVLNLGIFTLLVSLHAALDVVKFRTKDKLSWHWTIVETLRESLVDIFFIALGLLLGIAFHYSVAIGGLGKLARLEALMLNLVLRIGPRLKIAEHLLEIFLYWRHHHAAQPTLHAPLSKGEKGLLITTILITCAIFLVPYFTSMSMSDVMSSMQHELTPRLEIGIMHTVEELTH